MAGEDRSSKAKLAGPVHIRLGPLVSQETVYVAPIKDNMLLPVKIRHEPVAAVIVAANDNFRRIFTVL